MQNADVIWDHVDQHRDAFVGLSDRVFDTPETMVFILVPGLRVMSVM